MGILCLLRYILYFQINLQNYEDVWVQNYIIKFSNLFRVKVIKILRNVTFPYDIEENMQNFESFIYRYSERWIIECSRKLNGIGCLLQRYFILSLQFKNLSEIKQIFKWIFGNLVDQRSPVSFLSHWIVGVIILVVERMWKHFKLKWEH